jgi:hypothetical protein
MQAALPGGSQLKTLFAILMLALLASSASADTVWTYQGNVNNYGGMFFNPGPGGVAPPGDELPNPCNCALTGQVALDNNNNAISWSFTAAGENWTSANSTGSINPVLTIGSPVVPFVLWGIELTNNLGQTMISQFSTFSMLSARDSTEDGNLMVLGDPGKWTEVPMPTPEPSTLALLTVGLAGVLARKRWQAGRKAPCLDV